MQWHFQPTVKCLKASESLRLYSSLLPGDLKVFGLQVWTGFFFCSSVQDWLKVWCEASVCVWQTCSRTSVRTCVPGTLASDRSQVVSLSKNQPGEYRQPVKCELCPAAGDCKACLITGSAARLHPHSQTFKFTRARTEVQCNPASLVLELDNMCKGKKCQACFFFFTLSNNIPHKIRLVTGYCCKWVEK